MVRSHAKTQNKNNKPGFKRSEMLLNPVINSLKKPNKATNGNKKPIDQ